MASSLPRIKLRFISANRSGSCVGDAPESDTNTEEMSPSFLDLTCVASCRTECWSRFGRLEVRSASLRVTRVVMVNVLRCLLKAHGFKNSAVENRDMSKNFAGGDEEGINKDKRRGAAAEPAMSGNMIHDGWPAMGRTIDGSVCGVDAMSGGFGGVAKMGIDSGHLVQPGTCRWQVRSADRLF